MMPVPTVAGETGGVEAEHGADLAGAKPGNQLLEARGERKNPGRSGSYPPFELDSQTPV